MKNFCISSAESIVFGLLVFLLVSFSATAFAIDLDSENFDHVGKVDYVGDQSIVIDDRQYKITEITEMYSGDSMISLSSLTKGDGVAINSKGRILQTLWVVDADDLQAYIRQRLAAVQADRTDIQQNPQAELQSADVAPGSTATDTVQSSLYYENGVWKN